MVGISHRHAGQDAVAVLRSARARRHRGAPARAAIARVVQSFPRRAPRAKSPPALNHVTRTHPEIVRRYGKQIWLDPGEPEAQPARSRRARRGETLRCGWDCLRRLFLSVSRKRLGGKVLDFPDDASWKKFGAQSGLSRDDWRRANMNQFVQKISQSVKAAKPWVQFGISPFGIWRPGVPAGIDPNALDAYGKLYADAPRGCATAGWISSRRSFTGPSRRASTVFRDCSNGGGSKIPRAATSCRAQRCRNPAQNFPTTKSGGKSKPSARRPATAGKSIIISAALRKIPRSPPPSARSYAQPALVPASPWISAPRRR